MVSVTTINLCHYNTDASETYTHTPTYIYTYICIRMCMCVCEWAWLCSNKTYLQKQAVGQENERRVTRTFGTTLQEGNSVARGEMRMVYGVY